MSGMGGGRGNGKKYLKPKVIRFITRTLATRNVPNKK